MANLEKKKASGFALIELVVTIAILAILSTVLFFNFRSTSTNKTARNQIVSLITSTIRRAQTMSTSSTKVSGNVVCGFGVHYINANSIKIYAGSEASCAVANRNYQAGTDFDIENITIPNANLEIKSSFNDIFFEPPDPKTFINNYAGLSGPLSITTTTISVGVKTQGCGSLRCTDIIVKTSGGIDINDN